MSYPALLADVDPKALLERYEQGEKIDAIAATLKVSGVAIYRLLIDKEPALWKEMSSAHALVELERAEAQVLEAETKISLARAVARADHAHWKLERLLRRHFGHDAPTGGNGVQINIGIGVRTVDNLEDKTLTIDVPGK